MRSVRVTSGGQLQVDANGGGDAWATIATISGSSAVTIRYLAGGSATDLIVARSGQAQAMDSKMAADSDPFVIGIDDGLVRDALAGWDSNPVSHDPANLDPIAPQLDIYDIM